MIVQNREIFLLFFTYIFIPGGHDFMLHGDTGMVYIPSKAQKRTLKTLYFQAL